MERALAVAEGYAGNELRNLSHRWLVAAELVECGLVAQREMTTVRQLIGLLDQESSPGRTLDAQVAIASRDTSYRQIAVDDPVGIDQASLK